MVRGRGIFWYFYGRGRFECALRLSIIFYTLNETEILESLDGLRQNDAITNVLYQDEFKRKNKVSVVAKPAFHSRGALMWSIEATSLTEGAADANWASAD